MPARLHRRRLLLTSVAAAFQVKPVMSTSGPLWVNPSVASWLVLRRDNGVVNVDPVSSRSASADVDASVTRIEYLDTAQVLLLTLASGAVVVRQRDHLTDLRTIYPFSADQPPLLTGNRLIGRTDASPNVTILDLESMISSAMPANVLPGDPSDWTVHVHPTRQAALIDARCVSGEIVMLPAGLPREATIVEDRTASAFALAPDGNGIASLVPVDGGWRVSCGEAEDSGEPLPGSGLAKLAGPIGDAPDLLVLTEDRHRQRATVISCADLSRDVENETRVTTVDGAIDYWYASTDGSSVVFRTTNTGGSTWSLWRPGHAPRGLPELPGELAPAFASGSSGRWFHGATTNEAHLGSGERRFMAMDVMTGEIVLDQVADARLELSATTVSADGSVLAHVQAGNTGVKIMVVYLGTSAEVFRTSIERNPASAAASAIDVRIEVGEGMSIVAAGFSWDRPDHPAPWVASVSRTVNAAPLVRSVAGTLLGIVPEACGLG